MVKKKNNPAKQVPTPKFTVGSIVFLSKTIDADLNGFNLFPQYKKYTYTVEAYDGSTGVYVLRRQNLLLSVKETDILAPGERENNPLLQKQY